MDMEKPGNHIFLIGFMGAGKSTVASALSKQLGLELMEMDAELVRREGMAISEVFDKYGENYFRDAESKLVCDLQQMAAKVVSCGGGVVVRPQNVENMKKNGIIFLLTAEPETIYERVKDSSERPILNGNMNVEYIRSLMEKRNSFYKQAADHVIATDGKTVQDICKEITQIVGKKGKGPQMWKKELEVAIEAAREAGKAIREIYDKPENYDVEYKQDNSPLTAADKASNAIIMKYLKEAFPGYAVLSEEEKDDKTRLENDLCFVVDPLDGTKEFIKRNGQFTVNIALSYQHQAVMGVIFVPVTGELYYASQGDGAFLQKPGETPVQLHVTDNIDTESLKVVMSNSHGCEEMDRLLEKHHLTNFVKIGSSLKGCMVASGEADIYYRHNPTMEWDTAAMQCIVEEAGGIFRQMDDTPMLYNRENNRNDKGFYAINCQQNRLY